MANIDFVELFSLITMIIWAIVFVSTVPFLVVAAHGHQRSTLTTVVVLSVCGFVISVALWDSAHLASHMDRPFRQWVDYYISRAASLTMAVSLGWRTWSVMLRGEDDD